MMLLIGISKFKYQVTGSVMNRNVKQEAGSTISCVTFVYLPLQQTGSDPIMCSVVTSLSLFKIGLIKFKMC